jgi:uncharacterized protein with beta-barrel porin domain
MHFLLNWRQSLSHKISYPSFLAYFAGRQPLTLRAVGSEASVIEGPIHE